MAKSQTKKDKERFFADLELLDDSATETEDELEIVVAQSKISKRKTERTGASTSKAKTPEHQARRSPVLPSAQGPIIIEDTPKNTGQLETTLPITMSSSPTKSISKVSPQPEVLPNTRPVTKRLRTEASAARRSKKLKAEFELVPEENRIFKGFVFFFIPNDDIARPRKARIRISREHGAIWVTTFDGNVTHVIVEPHIHYNEAAKAFPNRHIPEGTVLVRTSWLAESVSTLYVRDVYQGRFRLKGAPEVSRPETSLKPVLPSNSNTKEPEQLASKVTRSGDLSSLEPSEELDEIIAEVRKTASLPLDNGPDDDHSLSSGVPESSFDSASFFEGRNRAQSLQQNKGFHCMQPNDDGDGDNPNSKTIAILQEMATHYDRTGDHWRTTAYRKAIGALRKQEELISSYEQAVAIPQIGTRLADKVVEIVATNRLRRLENAKNDPEAKVLKLLMGIYDVGFKQASLWMAQGYRSLSDLLEHANLTTNQKTGITHYDDFQQRIPRSEVAQHGDIVRQACLAVDSNLQVIIGGSYRRGSADSGDIDLLITKPDADMAHIRTLMNSSVIPSLFASGFMKCALVTSSPFSAASTTNLSDQSSTSQSPGASHIGVGHGSKFHGASCLPASSVWRRIDLLFVPGAELGAALVYFTGNDIFNRSMRLLASKKGMRLNQHGLYQDVLRGPGPGRDKVAHGALVEGRDERRIFEVLGVPWREPEERKC